MYFIWIALKEWLSIIVCLIYMKLKLGSFFPFYLLIFIKNLTSRNLRRKFIREFLLIGQNLSKMRFEILSLRQGKVSNRTLKLISNFFY